jgi:hypothetical protein
MSNVLSRDIVTISDYDIQVYNGQAILLGASESSIPREPTLEIPVRQGSAISWSEVFGQYPGKYTPGSSMIYLSQANGTEVIGTIAVNPLDSTVLSVSWDNDTFSVNTNIDSQGRLYGIDPDYGTGTSYRSRSPGTFDAIINPQKVYPGNGMNNVVAGDRFLIIEDIGSAVNFTDNIFTGVEGTSTNNGPDAWKSTGGVDFVANANDIIEWTGTQWNVVFNSTQESDTMIWQTNIYTGVQYVWNGVQWAKSFEGEYEAGTWRIEL